MAARRAPRSEHARDPGLTDTLYRRTVWRLLLPIAVLTFINSHRPDERELRGTADVARRADLTPTGFGLGVSTFFVAYLLFQYPHAMLLRRLGIRVWLLLSMTMWGIAGLMMSRVQDPRISWWRGSCSVLPKPASHPA